MKFITAIFLLLTYVERARAQSVGIETPEESSDGISNPIGIDSFSELVTAILDAVVVIAIPVAAIFLMYAGFLFVTARGNQEDLKKAKSALIWAVIGTAVILGATVIAEVIEQTIVSINP